MSNQKTAPTATAVFTDETLRDAADLAANAYMSVWIGPSGEASSGESVARHLEATVALLGKDGWIRVYDAGKNWSTSRDLAVDDSMTVKDMLKSLLRLVRDESNNDLQRTLATALYHVGQGGEHGDTDTTYGATRVLDLVIQAHTGSDTARATPWSERQHRTHADVTSLLAAGARFARTYGPSPAIHGK